MEKININNFIARVQGSSYPPGADNFSQFEGYVSFWTSFQGPHDIGQMQKGAEQMQFLPLWFLHTLALLCSPFSKQAVLNSIWGRCKVRCSLGRCGASGKAHIWEAWKAALPPGLRFPMLDMLSHKYFISVMCWLFIYDCRGLIKSDTTTERSQPSWVVVYVKERVAHCVHTQVTLWFFGCQPITFHWLYVEDKTIPLDVILSLNSN